MELKYLVFKVGISKNDTLRACVVKVVACITGSSDLFGILSATRRGSADYDDYSQLRVQCFRWRGL